MLVSRVGHRLVYLTEEGDGDFTLLKIGIEWVTLTSLRLVVLVVLASLVALIMLVSRAWHEVSYLTGESDGDFTLPEIGTIRVTVTSPGWFV